MTFDRRLLFRVVRCLANYHSLDFGVDGLRDMLDLVRRHGIQTAGAGENSAEAAQPGIICCGGLSLGMAAFCDHQADFAPTHSHPGIAYIGLEGESTALLKLQAALPTLQKAAVDWPVLSLHWRSDLVVRPSVAFTTGVCNDYATGNRIKCEAPGLQLFVCRLSFDI